MSEKKATSTQTSIQLKHKHRKKRILIRLFKSTPKYNREKLELINGDLDNVDPNNPILRMAKSAEKLGLVASRDDIAENFDEILYQMIDSNDD